LNLRARGALNRLTACFLSFHEAGIITDARDDESGGRLIAAIGIGLCAASR
jgi:hypothetical protein